MKKAAILCALTVRIAMTSISSAAEFGPWFKAMDTSRDGRITLDEFTAHQEKTVKEKGSRWNPELSQKQFAARDVNRDGAITPDETSPATRLETRRASGAKGSLPKGDPTLYFGRYRTFIAMDGRTCEARIAAYNDITKAVNLERDNKWNSVVDISALCPEDQAYILEWNRCKQFCSRSKFRISADFESRISHEDKKRDPSVTIEQNRYEVLLENRSNETIEGLSVEYCIYYDQDWLKNGNEQVNEKCVFHGQKEIGTIPPHTDKTLQTGEAMTFAMVWSYDSDRDSNVQEGEITGIRLRVHMDLQFGGRVTREYCWPEKIKKETKWADRSRESGTPFVVRQILKNQ